MDPIQTRLQQLTSRWVNGQASATEEDELAKILNDDAQLPAVDAELKRLWLQTSHQSEHPVESIELAGAIMAEHPVEKNTGRMLPLFSSQQWGWVAACVLLLLGTGAYLLTELFDKRTAPASLAQQPSFDEVLAGGNLATLTFSDGKQLTLDSAAGRVLRTKGIGGSDSVITYSTGVMASGMNTLSTPRGGQYQLQLSDGTKVWLNAASSITYPAVFSGKERSVAITGEVYMEVARDGSKPFKVQAGPMQIQVLGTKFNVHAYTDENKIRTTLLQGSVRINGYPTPLLLTPGEQAQGRDGQVVKVTTETEQAIAWKNGEFNFEGMGIEELMRQVARWYDVEVIYRGKPPVTEFIGSMKRNIPLSDLLTGLEQFGIQTRLEPGRKLVVLP